LSANNYGRLAENIKRYYFRHANIHDEPDAFGADDQDELFQRLEKIYTITSEVNEKGITILEGEYLDMVATRL